MIILKETKKNDSIDAYYSVEDGDPNMDVTVKEGIWTFMWHRKKSNENVTRKGFSFYLARHAFKDKYKIIDFALATDPKTTGILAVIPNDKKVMIVINAISDQLEKGIIRIVSASYVENQKLIDRYNFSKKIKIKYESMQPSDAEIERLAERIKKIMEEKERRQFLDI